MLREIQDDELQLLDDDPVRPTISIDEKLDGGKVLVLESDGMPDAVICIKFTNYVPITENELLAYSKKIIEENLESSIAIFYTLWSYKKGSGRAIVFEARDWIKENMPEIKRFVTLSPLTEVARRFHTRNGATELQVNSETQNFEYK
jgi:hypothetical protein|tara:strand:+ start:3072 stop:3512 length:441 start_codon:yes stop_codon:yes gene_type:complete